jgi:Transposase zinc-binding domain
VPLPAFVEQEFRDFLTCGILAHGFARLRCTECTLERLVPFSCKWRGFCPSCGGRRMTEGAGRLVDETGKCAARKRFASSKLCFHGHD